MAMTLSFKADAPPAVDVRFCADDMVMVDFGDHPLAGLAVQVLCETWTANPPAGLSLPIAGLTTVGSVVDDRLTPIEREQIVAHLRDQATHCWGQAPATGQVIELPVCYDPSVAPDLDQVAQITGLSTREVVMLHQSQTYRAALIGFMPGFAYLSGLDARLHLARRASPRPIVPAGALGIAGEQCAIYPRATPGGWHLIGRCPTVLFDLQQAKPARISLGDEIHFSEISKSQFERLWAQR